VKDSYVSYVLEDYIADGNFDAVFGEEWIDQGQLNALLPTVCDYAFAEYGIDAKGKYVGEVAAIFELLHASNGIVREGDDYAGFWYKLRPVHKKRALEELRSRNPVAKKLAALGEEALRRALTKIVDEDGLRSMDDKWSDPNVSPVSADGPESNTKPAYSPDPRFFESEIRKGKFVSLTNDTLEQIEASDLSNSSKAQARGYLIAARALSETPDPPVDLIWTILQRANSIAGIASFLVALITFLAMVA
jgi:hypothetical protein